MLLVDSGIPHANILHTLTQAELNPGAGECLLRAGVLPEYVQAALATPSQRPARPAVAAAEPAPAPSEPMVAPTLSGPVDIEVVGLQVGISKVGGMSWDGSETVDRQDAREIRELAAADSANAGQVAELIAKRGPKGRLAPNPLGFIELRGPSIPPELVGRRLPFERRGRFAKDAYSPRFGQSHGYSGLTLADGDGLQITVRDMEFRDAEMVGVAELSYTDLARAFQAGGVVPIYVGDQTDDQLLYVLVTVRPSAQGTPSVTGPLY